MTGPALETAGLGKTFVRRKSLGELARHPFASGERVRALADVSFGVARGEVFGLLGPNGAGKTTLIKILSGLILPTDGRAVIEGADASRGAEARKRLGLVIADDRSFYWRLTGAQNLRFFGRLHGLYGNALERRIAHLLERLDLTAAAGSLFANYSTGMRQRLAVARALLHDPPILLLDEPTRSLDPVAARSLRRFVQDELVGRDGKTVLIATHNLHEAETLCTRLAIIARGRIVASGEAGLLRHLGLHADRWRIEGTGAAPATDGAAFRVEGLGADRWRLDAALAPGEILDRVLERARAAGGRIHSCERVDSDLEEAFEEFIQRAERPQ